LAGAVGAAAIALSVACSSPAPGNVDSFCASVRRMETVVTTPQATEPGDPNAQADGAIHAYQRGLPFLVQAEKVAPPSIRPTVVREVALVRRVSQWDVSTHAGQQALARFLASESSQYRKDNQLFAAYIGQTCGIAPPSNATSTSPPSTTG
jgi:hypothetical protein